MPMTKRPARGEEAEGAALFWQAKDNMRIGKSPRRQAVLFIGILYSSYSK
jgi:hypothetical protein